MPRRKGTLLYGRPLGKQGSVQKLHTVYILPE
jgi:hypothetical protein